MKPFRERNPVVVGAISIAVLAIALVAAFRAQDLPLIGGGDTYYFPPGVTQQNGYRCHSTEHKDGQPAPLGKAGRACKPAQYR